MSQRSRNPSTIPTRARRVTAGRRIAPMIELEPDEELTTFDPVPPVQIFEPAASVRATVRNLDAPESIHPRQAGRVVTARGEFSIPSVRGIPSDAVSGSIESADIESPSRGSRQRVTTPPPAPSVFLARASRREITVMIDGQQLTIDRKNAVALAEIILTVFG